MELADVDISPDDLKKRIDGALLLLEQLERIQNSPVKPSKVIPGPELTSVYLYGKPTYKDAYKNVDKDKYPTYEDFEFAAKYYNETGINPDPQDLPSNRLPAPLPPEYQIEDIEPDISSI